MREHHKLLLTLVSEELSSMEIILQRLSLEALQLVSEELSSMEIIFLTLSQADALKGFRRT